MTPLMKKIAVQFGIISTLVSILYVLGIYIVDESLFSSRWGGILVLLATLAIFIFAVIQYKKENGGYASFREAFSAFMLPFIFAALLGMVFNLTFYNWVDADLVSRNGERQYDMMMEMPEEQLNGAMKFMGVATTDELHTKIMEQAADSQTLMGQLKASGMAIVFFSLIALVVAAVIKKNRPEFE